MENNIYKTIGQFIRVKRDELGFTQEELGNKIGVSTATISLYESGDRKPELDILGKIAIALGVSMTALLDIEIPDADLDVALRAQNLNHRDIKEVRQYIKSLKYARRFQNQAKQDEGKKSSEKTS